MSEYLFVYGTLRRRRNGKIHPFLQDEADYVGLADMDGKLFEINQYPGAIAYETGSLFRIRGEVYRLHDATRLFQTLDAYEECSPHFPQPHEYRRCKKSVILLDARSLTAWVYLYNRPVTGLTTIASGDYRNFLPS